jgi:hypothetical protein
MDLECCDQSRMGTSPMSIFLPNRQRRFVCACSSTDQALTGNLALFFRFNQSARFPTLLLELRNHKVNKLPRFCNHSGEKERENDCGRACRQELNRRKFGWQYHDTVVVSHGYSAAEVETLQW